MPLTPSRNFAGHRYILQHLGNALNHKSQTITLSRLRRIDSHGELLQRRRCSKKVQRAAKRAGLPNPKWQSTGKIVALTAA